MAKLVINTGNLIEARNKIKIGDQLEILLEHEGKCDKKTRWTGAVVLEKYSHCFLAEYRIKDYPIRISFKYQEMLLEKPTVRLKKEAIVA